jgi:hypothetical protein
MKVVLLLLKLPHLSLPHLMLRRQSSSPRPRQRKFTLMIHIVYDYSVEILQISIDFRLLLL